MAFRTSENPVFGEGLVDAWLAALSAAPGAALLTTPKIKLWTDGPAVPTPETVPGDLTEATFVGYAEIAQPALVGPINLPSTEGRGETANVTFTAGAGIVSPGQVVLGYWIDNDAGTLYMCERFVTSVEFVNEGDFLTLSILWGQIFQPHVA